MSNLYITNKGDQIVRRLADRHYSRQSVGNPQFCRPGFNIVLRTLKGDAAFVFWRGIADHGYDCWENTLFRNESNILSSSLIEEATRHMFFIMMLSFTPKDGIITYVRKDKVRSCNPGFCYKSAGYSLISQDTRFAILQIKNCKPWKIRKSIAC